MKKIERNISIRKTQGKRIDEKRMEEKIGNKKGAMTVAITLLARQERSKYWESVRAESVAVECQKNK